MKATTAKPTPTPTASRCQPVTQAKLDAIAEGAEASTGGIHLARGAAVQSKDFAKVYLVAAHLSAAGVKDEVGVWAVNDLAPTGGLIMAVDGLAQQFTEWPDASKTDAKITPSADGFAAVKRCVK